MSLTREEILAAPAGRELDNIVAKRVMGYKFPTIDEMKLIAEEQWKEQPSCLHFFLGFDAWLEDGEFKWKYNSKSYSTDISAAWEVVEKLMKDHRYRVDIISDVNYSVQIMTYEGCKADFHAPTAPEAICKAALLTVLEGKIYET